MIAGAQRFAHTNQLRADRALHALLGMKRFPSDDTILNYFRRFTQAEIERFWRPLWRWLIGRLAWQPSGYSLDLDSTIFSRHDSRWTLKNRARGRLQTQIAFCVSVAIARFHNAQSPVYRCSFKDCITLLHSSNASAIDWYRFVISRMCLMPSRSC